MPDGPERSPIDAGGAGAFFIEMGALFGIARLGWALGDAVPIRLALALAGAVIAGICWGIFRTRGFDPSGREPTVPVSGPTRIALEFAFYILGIIGLGISGWHAAAISLAIAVAIVIVMTRDRLQRLLATSR